MEHWNKLTIISLKNHDYHKKINNFQLGVVNSPQRRAGAMMNGTWNIANRILLLRVSQALIPQVRLSAFGGPHDAPCRRFHVPSADHIENAFRHDAPRRRFLPI